ncbi:radical SAM protein [bacterium]|nr:radical SAM protein [bacterium]
MSERVQQSIDLLTVPEYRALYLRDDNPYPQRLNIGLTARCPLKCIQCHQSMPGYSPTIELDDRSWQQLKDMIPHATEITVAGAGEPLLYKDFEEVIQYICDCGCKIELYSSLSAWRPSYAETIARCVNVLYCSIDAATSQTYDNIRQGGNFDHVKDRVRAIAGERDRQHPEGGWLKIHLAFMPMLPNAEELPMLPELAAELGADAIFFQPMFDLDELHICMMEADRIDRLRRLMDECRANCDRFGIEFVNSVPFMDECEVATTKPDFTPRKDDTAGESMEAFSWKSADEGMILDCTASHYQIMITSDGEVRPCWQRYNVMGNIREEDFAVIWNGGKFLDFRRGMHTPGESPCPGCASHKWIPAPRSENLPNPLLPEHMHDQHFIQGFWGMENPTGDSSYRWTKKEFHLFFARTGKGAASLQLAGRLPEENFHSDDVDSLTILIAGTATPIKFKEAGYFAIEVPVPSDGGHVVAVQVTCRRSFRPRVRYGVADTRELGILFLQAGLKETPLSIPSVRRAKRRLKGLVARWLGKSGRATATWQFSAHRRRDRTRDRRFPRRRAAFPSTRSRIAPEDRSLPG